jgi:hypothetical protein
MARPALRERAHRDSEEGVLSNGAEGIENEREHEILGG